MAVNFMVIAILFAVFRASSGTIVCQLEDDDDGTCTYKVICKNHPGNAISPSCNGPRNITFIITNSYAKNVNAGYFGATNFDASVRYMIAINNSWSVLSAQAFRYYSKSIHFDFSKNSIENIEQYAFMQLTSLQYLNLSSNLLSDLDPKSFLITDTRNTNLEILDLSYNHIRALPDEMFSYIPSLDTLYLQGNKIKSLSDHSFTGLKYLVSLYLQYNEIEMLNFTLISLKELKNIDVSHNALKKISGYEINRLQALEKVNMSYNVIEAIDNNCFVLAINLTVIDLSFNNITSEIDHAMFAANTKLEYLDFNSNHISQIEIKSFNRNSLRYLNLKDNNITGNIPPDVFTDISNITELDLSRQKITGLKNKAFANMNQLVNLNLSRNAISDIENLAFSNSPLIAILDLSYNNISKIDFITNSLSVNLKTLKLNNNNITVLLKNVFQNQKLMTQLDLSQNNIIRIEESSLPLQNLQYLNILNNKINVTLDQNMLSPAKFLRFLDFSYFNISKINRLTFVDMPVLARLNLSHSGIEKIDPENFKGMDNLYSIDLSYNNLIDLRFNHSLTKLKSAYLNNNRLVNISRIFPSRCNLSYLDMSHNGIRDVSSLDASLFPNLQVLHLSNNFVPNFNNPHTNSLTNLVDLGLASNNITEIDLSHFNQLIIVDLSNNNIQAINITFFKKIDFVQSIDLSQNNITDLPPGTFLNMKNLKFLNLSLNHIPKLRYGSLKGLHKTELLDISNNRIESLDADVFHECTQLKNLIIDYNRIKTLNIERLVLVTQKSLKTLSLGGNPISCQEIIRNGTLKDLSFYGLYHIEVTSIHKIYHEDNVHGIKCGDDEVSSTTVIVPTAVSDTESSSVTIISWCACLTIVLVAILVLVLVRWRRESRGRAVFSDSRVQLRTSLESGGSQYDVLGM